MFWQQCGSRTEMQKREGVGRPVCVSCGAVTYLDPKLAVAVVVEREGRILLGRRGGDTRSPGKWSFPAGFVERGERVEDALAREAREEAGIELTEPELLGIFSERGETAVLAVFTAGFSGEPAAGDDLVEVQWFSPDELPELAFAHDHEIVSRWQAKQRG